MTDFSLIQRMPRTSAMNKKIWKETHFLLKLQQIWATIFHWGFNLYFLPKKYPKFINFKVKFII